MSSRTLAKTKNQNSTTFSPVFGKKLASRTFTPQPANEARDVSNPEFGHNFGDVQAESPAFKQSCPLALSGPSHCTFGGACHTSPPRIQAKLKINQPGDRYEQEAEWVADQIMRMPKPKFPFEYSGNGGYSNSSTKQGNPMEFQTKYVQQNKIVSVTPLIFHGTVPSQGRKLDAVTRSFFESRFGCDFSRVRVHTDSGAASFNKSLTARAFTYGSSIYFGHGQYNPSSVEGKLLLAHELAHTVQQSRGSSTGTASLVPCRPSNVGLGEKAHHAAEHAGAGGSSMRMIHAGSPRIQRQLEMKYVGLGTQYTPKSPEERELRERLLGHMIKGLPPDFQNSAREAVQSFSTTQLRDLHNSGVRLFLEGQIPQSRKLSKEESPSLGPYPTGMSPENAGEYWAGSRAIELKSSIDKDVIRHELAHAWDDVRNDTTPFPENASRDEKVRVMTSLIRERFKSEAMEFHWRADIVEHAIRCGPYRPGLEWAMYAQVREALKYEKMAGREARPTYYSTENTEIMKAYEEYIRNTKGDSSESFDLPPGQGGKAGYSFKNPQEFYAVGFNVFHGDHRAQRERLQKRAPMLYRLLEREAESQGIKRITELRAEITPGSPI